MVIVYTAGDRYGMVIVYTAGDRYGDSLHCWR